MLPAVDLDEEFMICPEFLGKIFIDPETGCWDWLRSTLLPSGYGQMWMWDTRVLAHRYAYVYHKGPIPEGMVVRHLCHNAFCCNPAHLSLGTHKDNWADSEKLHREANIKKSYGWIINDKYYHSLSEAQRATGISQNVIMKHTNKQSRVFDTVAYRNGCIQGHLYR